MSVLNRFLERAEEHPQRTAIIEPGRRISYGDLARQSGRFALALAQAGIGKGDRVLVAVWPGIDLYVALAAVWRLGGVVVFPEPSMGLAGFRRAAAVVHPKALVAGGLIRMVSRLLLETRTIPSRLGPGRAIGLGSDPLVALGLEDPALISFTSGTTGPPKGIVRSHRLMLAQHEALSPLLSPVAEGEIDLVAFPAFVLSCLGHGTTAVMPNWNTRRHDRADVGGIRRLIAEEGVTRALLPPVVTEALSTGALPASLRQVLTGGGPVYPDVVQRFLANAPNVGLTVVYGSTEAEPISEINAGATDPSVWRKAAAGGGLPVGRPVREARVWILENEIVVAGDHVVRGYMDAERDKETKIHEGDTIWHRTGDAGRIDEDGQLWLLGRLSSVANGLFPFAVESAARLWPGVRAAALASDSGGAVLFISGDPDRGEQWRSLASGLGTVEVAPVAAIPMDRRHRSKPDIRALLATRRPQD